MAFLLLVAIVIIVALYYSGKSGGKPNAPDAELQLQQRNYEWAQFIARYLNAGSSKSQRQLIRRMLGDIAAKGLPIPPTPTDAELSSGDQPATPTPVNYAEQVAVPLSPVSALVPEPRQQAQINLDNTSLLLYFGAFLLVAATGLFVAFGSLPGSLKTIIVLVVALSLYWGGVWLLANRQKLRQAADAFAGIGMTMLPLTGLAAYSYMFHQSNGRAVWLLTSLVCLGLYWHALHTFRSRLIGYVWVFTLLSLFESSISMFHVPLFYYGWGMAVLGLGLRFYTRVVKPTNVEIREPSDASSMVFVPLAVFVSLATIGSQGVGQLGVSLLIAAAYYALEAANSVEPERLAYAASSQISTLLGVTSLVYAIGQSWTAVGVAVVALGFVQALIIIVGSRSALLYRNFATIALTSQITGLLTGGHSHALLMGTLAALVITGTVVWLRQLRADAYIVAASGWMSLPLVYGLIVARPALDSMVITTLSLAALFVLLATHLASHLRMGQSFADAFRGVFILSSGVVLVQSFWSGWWCLATAATIAAIMIYLAYHEKYHDWLAVAGIFVAAPMLLVTQGVEYQRLVLTTNIVAGLMNLGMALRFRYEANRWYLTILWLLLPLTLGNGVLGKSWGFTSYAVAYLVAGLGMVFARSVARGVSFVSSKVPLASYARSASQSYVVGYTLPLLVSAFLALFSLRPPVTGPLVLAGIAVAVWLLARYVEKQPRLYSVLPLIAEGFLWSVLRPYENSAALNHFLWLGSAVAALFYLGARLSRTNPIAFSNLGEGALVASWVTPLFGIVPGHSAWPSAVGLSVAGVMLLDYAWNQQQSYRELAGGIIILGIDWCLWLAGVHNPVVFAHIFAALFAAFAYWRYYRNDIVTSDQYVWLALMTSTFPLAVMALLGQQGGLYGWWLLLEQVAFMLIGIATGRRLVIRWGLYVAVAAVLFQLRGLGWAALTFLALFLIGLAVYRLQKTDTK